MRVVHATPHLIPVRRLAGLLSEKRVQLIDLRAPVQWQQVHIRGARNIQTDALPDELITLDRELPVVFYDNDESVAVEMAEALRAAGMTAYALAGGLDDWIRAGRAVDRDRSSPHEGRHMSVTSAHDLTQLTARQVMTSPLITCPPDTLARDVARMMATHRVHVIPIESDASPPRIVTTRELALVACSAAEHAALTAEEVAVDAITVAPDVPLPTAAGHMLERATSHVLVVDPASAEVIGVVSDADIVSRWSG